MSAIRPLHKALVTAAFATAFTAAPFAQLAAQDAGSQAQTSNRTVPDKAADAWITTKVKSEFATTKHIHATDISVDTTDGMVKLSGTVASAQEKMKAEKVARAVKGVKSVDATGLTVSGAANSDMPPSGK
ncbi:transporter [Frateuria sp. Soil773]|uniref:BON domain-containing protein n=1 Tax=Frateuria sp. Soil773 TaxID=1736407 RepID=UPI0006FE1517|nr:BON domain-containing protein [Frateuria sp. Soil773]KRE88564.1 transporter [Frateuria sp. Soil773]